MKLDVNLVLAMPLLERMRLAVSFKLPEQRTWFWFVVGTIAADLPSPIALRLASRMEDTNFVQEYLRELEKGLS